MWNGKRFGILLVVSLMLNAFLAGSLVTHFLRAHRGAEHHGERWRRGPGAPRWDGPAEGRLLRDLVATLGGPHDARVRTALGDGRRRMATHRTRLHEAEVEVRRALTAEPYDPARLSQALSELARQTEARQKEAQTTLIQLGSQLTAEQRAQLRSRPAPTPPRFPRSE